MCGTTSQQAWMTFPQVPSTHPYLKTIASCSPSKATGGPGSSRKPHWMAVPMMACMAALNDHAVGTRWYNQPRRTNSAMGQRPWWVAANSTSVNNSQEREWGTHWPTNQIPTNGHGPKPATSIYLFIYIYRSLYRHWQVDVPRKTTVFCLCRRE